MPRATAMFSMTVGEETMRRKGIIVQRNITYDAVRKWWLEGSAGGVRVDGGEESMNEVERIADQLQRAYHGDAWSGPNLLDALKDVTAGQAARLPVENAHSIWEIALHCAAWMSVVRERIEGEYVREPAGGDWQEVTDASDEAWREALGKLERKHRGLIEAVNNLRDEQLEVRIGTERDRATGAGVSRYVMLHGIAQHNLYHAGQIALLKKELSGGA